MVKFNNLNKKNQLDIFINNINEFISDKKPHAHVKYTIANMYISRHVNSIKNIHNGLIKWKY